MAGRDTPQPARTEGDGVRVAVDAMGGDHGPSEVVLGALDHARAFPADRVILVGDERVPWQNPGNTSSRLMLVEDGESPFRS